MHPSLPILLLLAIPAILAIPMTYPDGYYFTIADASETEQTPVFYVKGPLSYPRNFVGCDHLPTLLPDFETVYQGCGAMPANRPSYREAFVVANIEPSMISSSYGSRLADERTTLVMYTTSNSELGRCAAQKQPLMRIDCLSPQQQRVIQCLRDNLPREVQSQGCVSYTFLKISGGLLLVIGIVALYCLKQGKSK